MYTSQQSTDFNQRVDLGNSYCNCFHLMPRVEKSTWYIFKKESCSRDTPSCVSCKYSEIKNLKFQYQATRNFFLWMNFASGSRRVPSSSSYYIMLLFGSNGRDSYLWVTNRALCLVCLLIINKKQSMHTRLYYKRSTTVP